MPLDMPQYYTEGLIDDYITKVHVKNLLLRWYIIYSVQHMAEMVTIVTIVSY